jgi:uncharacterized protein YuzE
MANKMANKMAHKWDIDPETQTAFLEIDDSPIVRTDDLGNGVLLDFAMDGHINAVEVIDRRVVATLAASAA